MTPQEFHAWADAILKLMAMTALGAVCIAAVILWMAPWLPEYLLMLLGRHPEQLDIKDKEEEEETLGDVEDERIQQSLEAMQLLPNLLFNADAYIVANRRLREAESTLKRLRTQVEEEVEVGKPVTEEDLAAAESIWVSKMRQVKEVEERFISATLELRGIVLSRTEGE